MRLEDDTLYTAAMVADMVSADTDQERKRLRQQFRSNLNGHYRKKLPEPVDSISPDGAGTFYPAWTGRQWKMAAGLPEP